MKFIHVIHKDLFKARGTSEMEFYLIYAIKAFAYVICY